MTQEIVQLKHYECIYHRWFADHIHNQQDEMYIDHRIIHSQVFHMHPHSTNLVYFLWVDLHQNEFDKQNQHAMFCNQAH